MGLIVCFLAITICVISIEKLINLLIKKRLQKKVLKYYFLFKEKSKKDISKFTIQELNILLNKGKRIEWAKKNTHIPEEELVKLTIRELKLLEVKLSKLRERNSENIEELLAKYAEL